MVRYPIRVPRDFYGGAKSDLQRKMQMKNMRIAELERAVNDMISNMKDGTHVILYHEISRLTGDPVDYIRDIFFGVDCGHNGFTVVKGRSADYG